jgi:hypothetical protein
MVNAVLTLGGSSISSSVGLALTGGATSTATLWSSATSGTVTIGGTSQTGTITLGSSSAANTILIGNGSGATDIRLGAGSDDSLVGVGTTSSTAKLEVRSATSEQLRISYNATSYTSFTTEEDGSFSITAASNIVDGSPHVGISAGNTNIEGSNGGDINLRAGDHNATDGDGGWVLITGGTVAGSDVDGNGGNILLTPGNANGSGTEGHVQIKRANNDQVAIFEPSGLTSDRTFTFPDLSGTFSLLEESQTFTGIKTFSNATYSALFTGGNVGIGTATPTVALDINSNALRVRTARTPSSATDTCAQGEISWDSGFIYVCIATNSWKRSAIAAW